MKAVGNAAALYQRIDRWYTFQRVDSTMLEHEEQQNPAGQTGQSAAAADTKVSPADNVRVTAEEFTAALKAIEARRAAEADHVAGTVKLGETIRELNIDATPEQILAEIQAERTRKADQDKAKTDVKAKAQKTASDVWDYASAAYQTIRQRIEEEQKASAANPGLHRPIQVRVNVRPPWVRTRPSGGLGGLIFTAFMFWCMWGFFTGHLNIGIPANFPNFWQNPAPVSTPGAIIPLDKVADGQTAYCDTSTIASIISDGGTVHGAGSVQVMTNHMDNSWPIVTRNGKVYLVGFAPTSAAGKLTAGPVDILNDNDSGELEGVHVEDVTIPIDGVKLVGQKVNDGWSQVTVDHIKIDQFTQENYH
jgi:hypothetical protein